MVKAVRAVPVLFLLVACLSFPARAQNWNSAVTSGITSVFSEFKDGVYHWTLENNSSQDTWASYDVLVWELIPFQVARPSSWTAPEGWEWSRDRWELISNDRYYTPYALAPGASIQFRYTPDPWQGLVNPQGPQPEGLGFITHVAAVVPGSGSDDGAIKWTPASTEYGQTWYDLPTVFDSPSTAIPEAPGILVLAAGIAMLSVRLAVQSSKFPRILRDPAGVGEVQG